MFLFFCNFEQLKFTFISYRRAQQLFEDRYRLNAELYEKNQHQISLELKNTYWELKHSHTEKFGPKTNHHLGIN